MQQIEFGDVVTCSTFLECVDSPNVFIGVYGEGAVVTGVTDTAVQVRGLWVKSSSARVVINPHKRVAAKEIKLLNDFLYRKERLIDSLYRDICRLQARVEALENTGK